MSSFTDYNSIGSNFTDISGSSSTPALYAGNPIGLLLSLTYADDIAPIVITANTQFIDGVGMGSLFNDYRADGVITYDQSNITYDQIDITYDGVIVNRIIDLIGIGTNFTDYKE